MFDLSDEGREKFYGEFFNRINNLEKGEISESNKYKLLRMEIVALNSYENQRKIYRISLKKYWDLKKNQMRIKRNEEEIIGTNTAETTERERAIKKYEDFLNKISTSFKADLERIVSQDFSINSLPPIISN
jgi:VIT1/CCC1 family predicted Fe2+/Mn2+ transporter